MKNAVRLFLLAALAGCSSAEPAYYVLRPLPGALHASVARSIEIRRPGLAGFLDRADLVIDDSSYRLQLGTASRWAEPVGEMVERVVAEDLAQRLPASHVFGEGGAIGIDADLRVDLDVQQFGGAAGGDVSLTAELVVERRHDHVVLVGRHIALSAPRTQAGEAGLAAAMSSLLAQLSDQLATDIALVPATAGS